MTDYLTLTEFVPGTKAKAQDVNANFSLLKNAINQKAAKQGDSAQNFFVADALQSGHALNKGQLDSMAETLRTEIKKNGTKFCALSGYTTDGASNLFSYSVLTVTPKIGVGYSNLVISDYRGVQSTITSSTSFSMSGKADGEYNIFIKSDGTLYTSNNKIYIQPKRPTMYVGDVWLDTSKTPFNCIKYDGTSDIEFLDVPIGKVTILSNSITSLKTLPYYQNGHDINSQTALISGTKLAESVSNFLMPNYQSGVSKAFSTAYLAEANGFVYVKTRFGGSFYLSKDNATWSQFIINDFADHGFTGIGTFFVPKGIYYKAAANDTGNSTLIFYPCQSV